MWIAVLFKKKKKKCRGRGKWWYQMKCLGSALVWEVIEMLALFWLDNSGPNPSVPMQFQMISPMEAMLLRWHGWFRRAFPVTHLPFRKHVVLGEPVCHDTVLRDQQMLQAPSQSSLPVLGKAGYYWLSQWDHLPMVNRHSTWTGSCRIGLLHDRKLLERINEAA